MSRTSKRGGGVIVFAALSMVVLIAMTGLVIDGGNLFLIRQRLQAAADAGALAAAVAMPNPVAMGQRAEALVRLNNPGGRDLSVTVTPGFGGNPRRVEVMAQVFYTPCLLAVLGIRDMRIATRAVAENATATAGTWNPFGMDGIFGKTGVTFNGNANIDSYDSTLGSYGPTNREELGNVITDGNFGMGGNGRIFGDLRSPGTVTLTGNAKVNRATAGGNTTMSGNALIYGNLVTNGVANLSGNAAILGTSTENAGVTIPLTDLPPIDMSGPQASNNNASIPSGARSAGTPPGISISGNGDYTLPPGTYYLNSLSISGNGKLRIGGATQLYVTGGISVSGNGFFNANPNNLLVYSNGTSLNWSGNARFAGGVYAPNAALNLSGNGEIFGNFIARTISSSGNGEFHLDRGLLGEINVPGATAGVYGLKE